LLQTAPLKLIEDVNISDMGHFISYLRQPDLWSTSIYNAQPY